ncbi:disrupted in schizophrenia 1 protein isoform X2 [Engraulis encrasicolus]
MRTDLARQQCTVPGEQDSGLCLLPHGPPEPTSASCTNGRSGDQSNGVSPIKAKCHRPDQVSGSPESSCHQTRRFAFSREEDSCSVRGSSRSDVLHNSGTSPARDTFNSSFSFIQMSLDASLDGSFADQSPCKDSLAQQQRTPEPPSCKRKSPPRDLDLDLDLGLGSSYRPQQRGQQSSTTSDQSALRSGVSDQSWTTSQAASSRTSGTLSVPRGSDCKEGNLTYEAGKTVRSIPELFLEGELWRGDSERVSMPWNGSERMSPSPSSSSSSSSSSSANARESPADSDSCSLDTEATSSLSIDLSDAASASSVTSAASMTSMTSGYESAATPPASGDQSWDALMKKYEGALQDCLKSTRANTKIESMMLKLQRLQQKAVLDDDYDSAERFGKKLEELRRERASLQPGLPSRHPAVCGLLHRLSTAVTSALRRTNTEPRDTVETAGCVDSSSSTESPQHRKELLVQEKQQIQCEVSELRARLAELEVRSAALDERIAREEQLQELEEVEGPVLRSCTPSHLRQMGRSLEDLLTSHHRTRICLSPPSLLHRLQEQEQALSLSIKEATAKMVMSQRLGASLRRKVSESETQLLALHEAKLAAISGNDFSSAKELKEEMKAVYGERDRLEGLTKRLQNLSSGSSQDLGRMKEQLSQLKQDLQHRETQHERTLKENTAKYIELLEDRLHSCGSPALERVWEADLEACHLILRGLQLRTPSCSGPDPDIEENPPTPEPRGPTQPCDKAEADCAMLTALGGRWCPEANLQHSEFTKKLEEFLFCLEDNHPEDMCSDVEGQCERISDQLLSLEDQLQTAIDNKDQHLTLALEKEVREVKTTLQTLLMQLKDDDEDEEEEEEPEEEREEGHGGEPEEEEEEDGEGEEEEEEEEDEQYPDIMDGVDTEDDHYFSDNWEI